MRTTIKILALVVLNLLVAEAAVRLYFATQVGPRVLLYGTPWHRNVVEPFTYGKRAAANERLTDTPQTHGHKIGDSRAYACGATGYSTSRTRRSGRKARPTRSAIPSASTIRDSAARTSRSRSRPARSAC